MASGPTRQTVPKVPVNSLHHPLPNPRDSSRVRGDPNPRTDPDGIPTPLRRDCVTGL